VNSLPLGYRALVIGASGAIGGALCQALATRPGCGGVLGLSRSAPPLWLGPWAGPASLDEPGQVPHRPDRPDRPDRPGTLRIDVTDEASVAAAATALQPLGPWSLLVVATGALQFDGPVPVRPEKRLADIDPAALAAGFALNAVGPALVIKHFHGQLPLHERALLAVLSARVGSIGDNRKGGWYGYRAAKAALNMLLRTAAIEVARRRPQAVLVALHPGTVRSALTAPIIGSGPEAEATTPEAAAQNLLAVLDALPAEGASGSFRAWDGQSVPW
jgi:NAD(P)-dependent dehydrogenase (short-subunit alcohol dehydrogenase family)